MRRTWLVGVTCFVIGLLMVPALVFVYLDFGRPPVAVSDPALPFEKQIVRAPLHARINAEMQTPTLTPTEDNLHAGAVVYREQCAFCHGVPGAPSDAGKNMFPSAPQLWAKHRNGVVGVSDDPVGATYWRVKNGIRLTGMPSYKTLLTDDQMWQISLLLSSAAQPQPPSVQAALASR